MKLRYLLLIAAIAPLPLPGGEIAATPAIESAVDASPWRVRTGAMWRHLGGTKVNPRLGAGATAAGFTVLPTGVGDAGAFDNRVYDDGFVSIGAATPGTGLTTNFGYADEVQGASGSLVYTKGGGSSIGFPVAGQDGNSDFVAPYIELGYFMDVRPDLEVGLTSSFSFTGMDSEISQQVTTFAVTTRDSYPLGGIVLPLGPYTGSFAGPGPVIGNIPGTREQIFTPTGTGTYLFNTDTDLYSFAFGGEVAWRPCSKVSLNAGTGVVMNIANWEGGYRVPTAAGGTLAQSNDGTDFLLGLFLKTGAEYRIDDQWSVDAFVRYDWTESLEKQVGPSAFEVDLSGWSLGGGVTWRY